MKKLRKTTLFISVFLIIAAAGIGIYYIFSPTLPHVSYVAFYGNVDKGAVRAVQFKKDTLDVTASDGSRYTTENPDSPLLKEYLLKNGVRVSTATDADSLISTVFDVIFYAFFFGVIIVAFRKFISPNTFKAVGKTGVSFSDIIGMEALKKDMMQIVDIMQAPETYRARGVRMPRGILLEGEPGNGKTLFARALAGEAHVPFIPAKATDFESMFMAIGPLKVKLLFQKARRRAPCIVFIDEFDGIGTKRNYSGSAIETENTRIVTALLNELDGFTPNEGIVVIAATNSSSALDSALIRPGRFDAKYTIPYPDVSARRELAKHYLRGKKFESECTPDALATIFRGFSCAHIESTLNRAPLIALQNGRDSFTLNDVRNALKAT